MSTREAIRNLRTLITEKAALQVHQKAVLHMRHGSCTPEIMRNTRQTRVEITACLNYLHELKGDTTYEDPIHKVSGDDFTIYRDYKVWLRNVTEPLLDNAGEFATLDGECSGVYAGDEEEMGKAIKQEVRYLKAVKHGRVGWFGKLLHACGRAYTG